MLIQFYFFIMGATIGSFLTLCIDRAETKQSIIKPRSHCSNCQTILKPVDLIPIFSYCWLNGQCRYCHQRFPPTSCCVELVLGILYLHVFTVTFQPLKLFFQLFVVTVLIYLSLIDFKQTYVNGYFLGVLGLLGLSFQFTILNCMIFLALMLSVFSSFQFSNLIKGFGEADFELVFVFIILSRLQVISSILCLASTLCLILTLCFPHLHARKIPFIPYLTFGYLLISA